MSTLLEVKRSGLEWGKIIFPTDSLNVDHLTEDQTKEILRVICQELSSFNDETLFMPHEVAIVTIGSVNVDDYNDNELELMKSEMYPLVINLTDILFREIKYYANYSLISSDSINTVIAFQRMPKEYF